MTERSVVMERNMHFRHEKPIVQEPGNRDPDWVKARSRVVVVFRRGREIVLRPGYVCDRHGILTVINGVAHVIVRCDQVVNEISSDSADAHEVLVDIQSPAIVKDSEVWHLSDSLNAVKWFDGMFSTEESCHISVLMTSLITGLHRNDHFRRCA